jgi:hypothetical protein
MGQNTSLGMFGPWLRSGDGGFMNEILFNQLVATVVSETTENTSFQHFTLNTNISVFKRPIALLAFFLKGTTVPEDVT